VRRSAAFLALALLGSSAACFGPSSDERLAAALREMDKVEAFEKGKALIAKRKWVEGRKYLTYVFENFPGEAISREALLRLADSYFEEGSDNSLIEGRYRYQDYLSRFPNRPEADYVMMRVADCYFGQGGDPDRDLTSTKKALTQYQEVLRQHPETVRKNEVVEKIRKCRNLLGSHEMTVGKFYARRGFSNAAVERLAGLLQTYPDFDRTDETLFWLVRACLDAGLPDRAAFYRHRLETEFPESSYTDDAPEVAAVQAPEGGGNR
jgi:outer membrane protein assembly factor BamD